MQFWRHIRKSIHELVLPKSNNKRHYMELLNTARFYQRAHFYNRLATSAVLACSPAERLQEETVKIAPGQNRQARVSWNTAVQSRPSRTRTSNMPTRCAGKSGERELGS